MADEEIEMLNEVDHGSDENPENKLSAILIQVTTRIRGQVAACTANTLGSDGTVPDEVEDAAVAIARHRFLSSVPNFDEAQGEMRKEEYRDAIRFMQDVAKCLVSIVPPGSADDSGAYGGDAILDFAL